MKPNHMSRDVSTSGVKSSSAFKISIAHSAHIMKILRDQLYSDKKLAVLREYSANAWDANREVGNEDKPIKVTLPTTMDPTLYIRDYGPGIAHEDMFEIYAQYGESTKRATDGQVGMLGIGSKSGFAYTDSFTITTWQHGVQRIYTALLDDGNAGSLNLLDESPSDEPTGTMIQIPVKPHDIPEFVERAHKLFIHFKPRPEINTSLPPELVPEVVMQHGTISRGEGEWLAVMGCIAYPIDLDQLRGINAHRGGAGEFLDRLNGYLYFNIGEVEIAASREGLEYSDRTKEKLIDKFIDLIDEFVKHTLDTIEAGDFSFWEKRCRAQVLNDLKLPIPGIMKTLTDEKINLGEPKNFVVTYGPKQNTVQYIHVDSKTRLLIRDEVRRIDGYGISGFDYVIRPNKDIVPIPTLDQVREELTKLLDEAKMTGIPVVNISTVPWHEKAKFNLHPVRESNKKHQVKTFVIKQDHKYFGTPYSDGWEIETITPSDQDVFVLLRGFKVLERPGSDEGSVEFYANYVKDRNIIRSLKFKMPKIYGYKSTKKDPIKVGEIKGIPYSTWRVEFLESMLKDPRVKTISDALYWVELIIRVHRKYYYRESDKLDPKIVGALFQKLGAEHPICALFRKIMVSKRILKRVPGEILGAVKNLHEVLKETRDVSFKSEPETILETLEDSYPMFKIVEDGVKSLLDEDKHFDKWIDYIKLVDRAKEGLNNGQSTAAHYNERGDHGSVEGEIPRREEGSSELCEPAQGNQRETVGHDRGAPVSPEDSQSLVERQVQLN